MWWGGGGEGVKLCIAGKTSLQQISLQRSTVKQNAQTCNSRLVKRWQNTAVEYAGTVQQVSFYRTPNSWFNI